MSKLFVQILTAIVWESMISKRSTLTIQQSVSQIRRISILIVQQIRDEWKMKKKDTQEIVGTQKDDFLGFSTFVSRSYS